MIRFMEIELVGGGGDGAGLMTKKPPSRMNNPTIEQKKYSIEEAAAAALTAIECHDLKEAQQALAELTRRNKALLDGGDAAIADSLSRQAVVLEALVYYLLRNAVRVKTPEVMVMALKSAMSSQRALLNTLGAIRQLRGVDA